MTPTAAHLRRTALAALLLAAAGCEDARGAEPSASRKLHVVEGFSSPESVRYDPDQDLYFVSSMMGPGSAKDGQAYISRIDAADPRRVDTFVRSGRGGATLHAPKGMAIQGDTLWVADVDALRGFHRVTGAPVGTIDFRPAGAVLLNDVAIGPDSSLYVTDTGIEMTKIGVFYRGGDRVFSVGPGRRVSVVAEGEALRRPNGVTWDPAGRRWLIVSFYPYLSELYTLNPDGGRSVLAQGKGRFDGVERLADGRIVATSWSDSSVHLFDGESNRILIRELWQPADLGVDTRRNRLAIPLVLQGRVELWSIPPR